MIRLLLVDDQDLIRRGMTALLKSDEALQVVGEAANGQDAIALVASLTPDVVLMDVRMPVMDGVAATKAICQQFPGTKILVLTTLTIRNTSRKPCKTAHRAICSKIRRLTNWCRQFDLSTKATHTLVPAWLTKPGQWHLLLLQRLCWQNSRLENRRSCS